MDTRTIDPKPREPDTARVDATSLLYRSHDVMKYLSKKPTVRKVVIAPRMIMGYSHAPWLSASMIMELLEKNPNISSLCVKDHFIYRIDEFVCGISVTANKLPHLTSLELENCQLDDDIVKSVSDMVRSNATLRSLSLRKNKAARGWDCIFESMMHNTTITSLNLSHNYIINEGAVAEMIKRTGSLEELFLSNVLLKSLSLIGNALEVNSSLKTLSLAPVMFANVAPIGKALETNVTLLVLHIGETFTSNLSSIKQALQTNTTLISLDPGHTLEYYGEEVSRRVDTNAWNASKRRTTLYEMILRSPYVENVLSTNKK